jgi:DNA-binding transcriptional LysR family regulator
VGSVLDENSGSTLDAYQHLANTRRVLTASPGYLASRGVPKGPEDLSEHDFLIYVYTNSPNSLRLTCGNETQVVTVQGLLESNDGQVLRAAALDGLGILVQPSYIVYDDIVAGRLIPLLNEWDLPRLQINIAFPSKKYLSAKVRSFIDFMVDEFDHCEYERKWTSYLGLRSAGSDS